MLGTGDCEGIAILAINRLAELGYQAGLALLRATDDTGTVYWHAAVWMDGTVIGSLRTVVRLDWQVRRIISHAAVMKWIERTRVERGYA